MLLQKVKTLERRLNWMTITIFVLLIAFTVHQILDLQIHQTYNKMFRQQLDFDEKIMNTMGCMYNIIAGKSCGGNSG